MTIVYEYIVANGIGDSLTKKLSSLGVEVANEEPDTAPMSTNLERMRNNIRKLMRDKQEKVLYSNVARYLISIDKDKSTDDIDDEQIDIDELRAKSKQLSETIESELIEYMKKEVKSLKLTDVKEFETELIKQIDDIDVMSLKPNVGYIISSINLNTLAFCDVISGIAELFDKLWLIKCGVDDCYTERVVLLVDGRNDNHNISGQKLPIYQEQLINFLYAVYSNAEFVLSSNEDEYKKVVARSIKLINAVKLF